MRKCLMYGLRSASGRPIAVAKRSHGDRQDPSGSLPVEMRFRILPAVSSAKGQSSGPSFAAMSEVLAYEVIDLPARSLAPLYHGV
jgi:hypothetical protein